GVYNFYLGDYGLAKDYLKACIEIRERLYPANHYLLIGPYEVLGIAYEASGNVTKTLSYLEKTRPMITSNYGKGSVLEGYNYENTALGFKSLGLMDSSIYYIKNAHEILTKSLPSNSMEISVHYFSYALVLYDAGYNKKAGELLSRSNAIMETLGMSEADEFSENLALSGMLAIEGGNLEASADYFERAFNIIRLPNGEYKLIPATLNVLSKYNDYLWSKYKITQSATDRSDYENFSKEYISVSNQFRRHFLDSYTKSVLVKNNAAVYERSIRYFANMHQQDPVQGNLEGIFSLSENARAAKLRDLLDIKKGRLAGYPEDLWQKEAELKNTIGTLEETILERGQSDSLLQQLVKEKAALNQFLQKVKTDYPRLYNLRFNAEFVTLEEVQNRLQDHCLVIEYLQDDSFYYALTINKENSNLVKLGGIESIDAKVKNWNSVVRKPGVLTEYKNVANDLYRTIILPLHLQDSTSKLLIVPVGPLFYVNFETLWNGNDYLIMDYEINYAISLDLYFKPTVRRSSHKIISIAPGFEDNIKEKYKASLDSLSQAEEDYLKTVRQPWSVKLAQELSGKAALTGLDANEAKVKRVMKNGEVLFFGTHAISNEDDPIRSRLLLAKKPNDKEEDGLLHAYEIFRIPLTANLAVLTACESGLGEIQKGEGMISLAYSLHFAGCPSTVMSLWSVDEKTSTAITGDFFEKLSKGKTKGEALREAKLNYLEASQGDLTHPFYWGGLVFMGQDGRISTESLIPFKYLFLGIIALMTITWAVLRKRV
ncbi:MAG: CHAT domain-containing protein, partial [Saprospiraceae bacterium]|nr:CHAT domain-containing protein [Saprospiraceae bacterium]